MGKYVKENLSQLVSRVIRQEKFSLREVQDRSGGQIEKSYISRIMTGNVKNITLEKLIALARGLNLDPHTLFDAYYARPQNFVSDPQDVIELKAPEFAALMHKVAMNPKLVEILEEIVQLQSRDEIVAMHSYALYLNERRRKMYRRKPSLPLQVAKM